MHIQTHYPTSSDAPWPQSMRSHPIFEAPDDFQPQQNASTVAVNNQIRIASVQEAKSPRAPRSYKTLHAPQIQFQIEQMVLNADGRLLAVAGTHQVAVVVLPSSSRGGRSPLIECRSIRIAPFYYGAKGSPRIAKLDWHPLGEGNTSLFVLTADALLREFDVTVDAEEPLQTFSFLQRRKRSSTFNTEDSQSTEAVSFTFGCSNYDPQGARGISDWTPLTVYGLLRGGDLYALCPVCPSRIRVDPVFIRSLEAYVRGKEALAFNDSSLMSTPVPAFNPTSSFSSSTSSAPGMEELDLPSVYDHQRKYITTLSKQLPSDNSQQPETSSTLRRDISISSVSTISISSHSNPTTHSLVTLNAPTTIKLDLEAQGPFRFQPAPAPSPEPDWDELASDIIYLKLGSSDGKRSSTRTTAAGTILIAYADGRVDVCLDLVKVEAVWCHPGASPSSPVTLVLETINLNFLSYFRPAPPPQQARPSPTALQPLLTSAPLHPRFLASNHPVMIRDAVYEPQANEIGIMAEAAPHLQALQKSSDALSRSTLAQSSDRAQSSGISTSSPPAYAAYNSAPFVGVVPYRPPPIPPVPPVVVGKTEADPAQLRQFATAVATLAEYHRTLNVTAGILEERVFLLTKERDRQSAVAMTLKSRTEKLVGRDGVGGQRQVTLAKYNRISSIQPTLLKRIDWVLQRLMDTYNGALTEKERQWFDELKRMRKQVLSSADGSSLVSKTEMLSKQLELLMPTVQEINKKEKAIKEEQNHSNKLGTKQMLDIGRKLGSEDIHIKETVSKIQTLASRMGLATAGLPDENGSE
ncbi:hypothetical protein FRC17_010202 [Serendipita sp. 399]|nr:hypothetical protein FRC17_010202 [Serendipita sp. 399]